MRHPHTGRTEKEPRACARTPRLHPSPTNTSCSTSFPPVTPHKRDSTKSVSANVVAMHAATTLLPARAKAAEREQVRRNWTTFLSVVFLIDGHPDWSLGYIPGVHHGEGDTYAVHRPTGRVFGGGCTTTGQQRRETTDLWLTRLTRELDGQGH